MAWQHNGETTFSYRENISAAYTLTVRAETINCRDCQEVWFYIHETSGTVTYLKVQAMFWNKQDENFYYGATRELTIADPFPAAIVADVKGHNFVGLQVMFLAGASPVLDIDYGLVQEGG